VGGEGIVGGEFRSHGRRGLRGQALGRVQSGQLGQFSLRGLDQFGLLLVERSVFLLDFPSSS